MSLLLRLTVTLLTLSSSVAIAQEDAGPFGLTWLASSEDVVALGATLVPMDLESFGQSYIATNLPKALSDIEAVVLSFGYDNTLWRVAALSSEFENDRYGSQAKARYEQLSASLSKSYSLTDTYEVTSTDNYFMDAEKFAYALSKDETFWYSIFESDVAEIELSIDANYEDTFWRLIYTHNQGKAAFNSGKADAEVDAL
ncbi:hypothetical protein [Devosia sp. SL43]|uniref:hypothetical protein n=1 Tax=Devosia sp. SL43 TaxID=2806348 RepID=UPI001F1ADD47|nr:hypothetical protein [Devosia sp. SL43]UJW86387.1 hypothetical protein IM737_03680 [Devosia sp. SL43]